MKNKLFRIRIWTWLRVYLRTLCHVVDKHDWLDWRDYHEIGFVLYWLEWDNPSKLVLYIELARLACLGFLVSTPLIIIIIFMSWPTAFWGFIDGPVTRTSGWAVDFRRRPWLWIVGSGLGPCYYSQDRELGSPWSRILVSVVRIGIVTGTPWDGLDILGVSLLLLALHCMDSGDCYCC